MKWLAVTVAVLAASASLVVGIYFRDRHFSDWHPTQAALADADAGTVLSVLRGYHCHHECSFKLLGHERGSKWVARVQVPSATRCFQIDLREFAFGAGRLSGVEPVGCPTAARAA